MNIGRTFSASVGCSNAFGSKTPLAVRFQIGSGSKGRPFACEAKPTVGLVEVRHQETFVLEPLPRLRYGSTHLHTPMLWVCRRVRVPQRHLKVRKGHARATFLLDQLQEHDAHIFRAAGE